MKKNHFTLMAVFGIFLCLNANIFAEDYYVLYKNNTVTKLFAGSAIDSVRPDNKTAAENLLFYTGAVPETVVLPDSVVFKNITDLSKSEKANCYIIPSSGTYMFDTELRDGTLKSGDAADYVWTDVKYQGININNDVVAIDSLFTVGTVKEVSVDGVADANWVIKDIQYIPALNKIMFTATGNIGNSLIALYTEGEGGARSVVWSWHVWSTGVSAENMEIEWKSKNSVTYNQYPVVILDRNIGALTAVNVDNLLINGLHYEWGRKDPFPTARKIGQKSSALTEATPFADAMPVKFNTAFGSGFSYYGVTTNAVTMESSTAYPTTFYRGATADANTWATDMSGIEGKKAWGDIIAPFGTDYIGWEAYSNVTPNATETYVNGARPARYAKTKYDPCPAGYRVPTAEQMWLTFSVNKVTNNHTAVEGDPFWQNTLTARSNITFGIKYICPSPNTDVSTRMPASGERTGGGKLTSYGYTTYYWTATPNGAANGAYNYALGNDPRTTGVNSYAAGRPVRCVKEVVAE